MFVQIYQIFTLKNAIFIQNLTKSKQNELKNNKILTSVYILYV